MIRVALKGMATRRLRVVLTALSIVLGVAMVSAAFTLGDTLKKGTDSLSTAAYDGTDAVVVAKQEFITSTEEGLEKPSIPAAALDQVRNVPGVETAIGSISDQAKIVGKDGETVGEGPYFGAGLDARDADAAASLTPFRLETGRYASGPSEVVIDKGTADKEKLAVGDKVKIATGGPAREFEVVGVATFGDVKSIGTATFSIFDLSAAQELFGKDGSLARGRRAGNRSGGAS
jgi:putative ABC transport system permease protein